MTASPPELDLDTREALAELLLSVADDEFVIGFWDSEWTGIAPMLEEDVATSSIAQDEIGHAKALYELLAELTNDDPDRIAYGRDASAFRHAALLNHARGDWAFSVARRYLYETADAVRLEALVDGTWAPLADLVGKMRREERYHTMHIGTWFERLARTPGEPHDRLAAALATLGPDAATVFTPIPGEPALLDAGVVTRSLAEQETAWRAEVSARLRALGLPELPATPSPATGRGPGHGPEFDWLHGEFTMVRRTDPVAAW